METVFARKGVYSEDRSTFPKVLIGIEGYSATIPKCIAKLLGYSFEVVYKLGLENKAVEALSRMPPVVHLCNITAPTLIDLKTIKEEVENDDRLKLIMKETVGEDGKANKYSIQQGMLRYKGRLVLSKSSALIPTILYTYHDFVFGGHFGFLRTYKRVVGELYWEGMKLDVHKYSEECLICQKNKAMALSPAWLLLPLEIPNSVWSDICVDFVEGLPKSNGYEVFSWWWIDLASMDILIPLKHPYTT